MRITKAHNYLGHLTSIWKRKMSTVNRHRLPMIVLTMLIQIRTSLTGQMKNLRKRLLNSSASICNGQKGHDVRRILILTTKTSLIKPSATYLTNVMEHH